MSDSAYWNQMYANALQQTEPSQRYKPRLFIDGDRWCALYGEDLQSGVAGFGSSPEKAYWDFDRAWCANLTENKSALGMVSESEMNARIDAAERAAWEAALNMAIGEIPGGSIIDPQWVCDKLRELGGTRGSEQ